MSKTLTFKVAKTLTFDIGTSVEEAEAAAKKLASDLYEVIPTGYAPGQAFKNSFVQSFLHTSGRARDMAREVLGYGTRKAVKPEYALPVVEEKYGEDEDDDCCDDCCHK